MKLELVDIIPVRNELGEGITWDHQRQKLWWVDIDQSKLYRYDFFSKQLEAWNTPERLCCFAPVENSDYLVAAFASGFAYYQPETNSVKWIKEIEQDNPGTRLNDGRTDRQGRFWSGSMVEDDESATQGGALYRLEHDLQVSASGIKHLQITNSLCWNPDSSRMYHCDTPEQTINQYDFNKVTAAISNKQTLAKTKENCYPDGSTVDSEGYIWNAQWGGSKVVRYTSEGAISLELKLPVTQPSCVAFAGSELNLLAVTTAHRDLADHQRAAQINAGDVFIYETETTGLIESPFKPVAWKRPENLDL